MSERPNEDEDYDRCKVYFDGREFNDKNTRSEYQLC